MKENFIELTSDGVKVLVNLMNVIKILSEKEGGAWIEFNFIREKYPFRILVGESYDEVKKLIGLTKREAKVL